MRLSPLENMGIISIPVTISEILNGHVEYTSLYTYTVCRVSCNKGGAGKKLRE